MIFNNVTSCYSYYCFSYYYYLTKTFLQSVPKSFLSLDVEGRVIRLDSFSKVLSSGLRIGYITAAAPLLASIELHMQSSHLHAPSLSQVIFYYLYKTNWIFEKKFCFTFKKCLRINCVFHEFWILRIIYNQLLQVVLYRLLKVWGHEGLMNHFARIRHFYRDRRDAIVQLAHKYLHGKQKFYA